MPAEDLDPASRLRLLLLAPYAPYPQNSGGRIRQWQQIRYLGKRHDLTVVTFVHTAEEYRQRKVLDEFCRRVIVVRPLGDDLAELVKDWPQVPWPLLGYASREMKRVLEEVQVEPFDAVLMEHIFMAQYRDLFHVPVVLAEQNIESNIFRQYAEQPDVGRVGFGDKRGRPFWTATWRLMVDYENRMWARFPLRTTVSFADKVEMDGRCPAGTTLVVPNGVDTAVPPLPRCHGSRRILFMGTLNYAPNIDAACYMARTIMPLVWAADASATLLIAGRDPVPEVSALVADPRIEVTANPDDMRRAAENCRLTVVPLRSGGGTRIKILDSMAMGLPVVSTALGCQGLAVINGENILIRNEPAAFAEAVVRIVADDSLWEGLRRRGRRLVEDEYEWQSMFRGLEIELAALTGKSC